MSCEVRRTDFIHVQVLLNFTVMSLFRNPLRNPTEVDILGVILVMAGTFLAVAGSQGVYELQRIGVDSGEEREVLMSLAISGCLAIVAGVALFIRRHRRGATDVLDEDHFSSESGD